MVPSIHYQLGCDQDPSDVLMTVRKLMKVDGILKRCYAVSDIMVVSQPEANGITILTDDRKYLTINPESYTEMNVQALGGTKPLLLRFYKWPEGNVGKFHNRWASSHIYQDETLHFYNAEDIIFTHFLHLYVLEILRELDVLKSIRDTYGAYDVRHSIHLATVRKNRHHLVEGECLEKLANLFESAYIDKDFTERNVRGTFANVLKTTWSNIKSYNTHPINL